MEILWGNLRVGNISIDKNNALSEGGSLVVSANSNEDFIIAKPISKTIEIKNHSIAVLI